MPDIDLIRELNYRKVLNKHNQTKNLLTKYHGEVETTLGKGFIFDRVVDFDGKTSNNLIWLFENYKQAEALLHDSLFNIVIKFRKLMYEDMLIVSDTDQTNTMIQRLSENEYTFKVIDNIGTPVTIPLAYYFDYFAKKRTQRYWKRFVNTCHNRWPDALTDSEWKNLL